MKRGEKMSIDQKRKIGEANKKSLKGMRLSEAHKMHIGDSKRGIPFTEDHKQKISESRLGDKNPLWKGDEVRYKGLHKWIRMHKPCQTNCALCGQVKPLELANLSGEYKRDIEDFIWACRQCHRKYDKRKRDEKKNEKTKA